MEGLLQNSFVTFQPQSSPHFQLGNFKLHPGLHGEAIITSMENL